MYPTEEEEEEDEGYVDEDVITGEVSDDILLGGSGTDPVVEAPIAGMETVRNLGFEDSLPFTEDPTATASGRKDILHPIPEIDLRGLRDWPEIALERAKNLPARIMDPDRTGADHPRNGFLGYGFRSFKDTGQSLVYGAGKGIYDLIHLGYLGVKYSPEAIAFVTDLPDKVLGPLVDPAAEASADWILEMLGENIKDNSLTCF